MQTTCFEILFNRDIKPENLLLKTLDGTDIHDWSSVKLHNLVLKLSDFGLSRQLSESRASESIDMTVVGTLHYLAPEVKDAMVRHALSHAPYSKYSDIWACGCVSYYLFKKKTPGTSVDNNHKFKSFIAVFTMSTAIYASKSCCCCCSCCCWDEFQKLEIKLVVLK